MTKTYNEIVKAIGEIEMEQKLKNCPFCNNSELSVGDTWYGPSDCLKVMYQVFCLKCGAQQNHLDYDTEEKAINAWNKRA